MSDAYDAEILITRRTTPYVDPRPLLFTCAICERDVHFDRWNRDGRSRPVAPICLTCEQAYGGTNLSSWTGFRMDARIARQVNACAVFLQCLVERQKQKGRHHGPRL